MEHFQSEKNNFWLIANIFHHHERKEPGFNKNGRQNKGHPLSMIANWCCNTLPYPRILSLMSSLVQNWRESTKYANTFLKGEQTKQTKWVIAQRTKYDVLDAKCSSWNIVLGISNTDICDSTLQSNSLNWKHHFYST